MSNIVDARSAGRKEDLHHRRPLCLLSQDSDPSAYPAIPLLEGVDSPVGARYTSSASYLPCRYSGGDQSRPQDLCKGDEWPAQYSKLTRYSVDIEVIDNTICHLGDSEEERSKA